MILAIRPEDDGSFFCSAQNPAGVARANFTVRIVDSLDGTGVLPGTNSPGGLQENTNLLNKEGTDMFKVRANIIAVFV